MLWLKKKYSPSYTSMVLGSLQESIEKMDETYKRIGVKTPLMNREFFTVANTLKLAKLHRRTNRHQGLLLAANVLIGYTLPLILWSL